MDNTLKHVFPDLKSLQQAYMPFVNQGGIFIRTSKLFSMGEKLNLRITLPFDPLVYEVEGKVVWITPEGAQENKPAGIGCQFLGKSSSVLKDKIESCLADVLESLNISDTV